MTKAFWWQAKNFGDKLTPIIIKHFLGIDLEYVDRKIPGKLLAVGSILHCVKENDVVWGAGLNRKTKIVAPANVKFLAVRGKLTRELIDGNVPEVYGDPAILLPLIYKPAIEKKYKVGLLPHYVDKKLWDGQILPTGTKFIDIQKGWKQIIDDMLACEVIKTSSLHGIIAANAYGIPVIWEKYSDKIVGGELKFQDYFSGVEIEPQKYGNLIPVVKNLEKKQEILVKVLKDYYG